MRKIAVLSIILSAGLLSACGTEESGAQLGSSLAEFEEEYGENAIEDPSDSLFDYQSEDGYVSSILIDDHAAGITLSFESKEDTEWSEEDALEASEEFLPSDAEMAGSEEVALGDQEASLYVYESEYLHELQDKEGEGPQTIAVRLYAEEEGYRQGEISIEDGDEEEQ
ncbi:hypothetical protein CR205_03105 [Alteribacter lacisalsi]|uniref:Uncharacterized protein n=1 Tax=Alteribacter lacisalsi TaxID=2045244 RepID=A0A2W0HVB1_9BACI|nr:hypothetical protein [Alteribacter lacisalsi]PYZ97598.1 hypothetical protein CR205_03105 [Alteribacter lacisalsi]